MPSDNPIDKRVDKVTEVITTSRIVFRILQLVGLWVMLMATTGIVVCLSGKGDLSDTGNYWTIIGCVAIIYISVTFIRYCNRKIQRIKSSQKA